MMQHIHLNPLGGIAGDMFVAAMLDAFPAHAEAVIQAARALSGVPCRLASYTDGLLAGRRFLVEQPVSAGDHHHHHAHTDWAEIRSQLQHAAALPDAARAHAIGIFTCLAEAEGRVHGIAPDAVTFHEVGAADSIADIVAAAMLIAAIGPASWSTAALPAGFGTVHTAHGLMPVPTPATALLLEGFALHDDGVGGERVTPTGAAILRYLNAASPCPVGVLGGSGIGFGTRLLPGISNCLRVLVFDTVTGFPDHGELAMVSFEVDDQSGEDLTAGLDRVRATPGVDDVVQLAAIGKKGRMAVQVQVLARPHALDAVVEACFRETTTIGLRTHLVQGRALPRRFADVAVAGQELRVKLVDRPGGVTGKVEADHLKHVEGHAARVRLRQEAERLADPS